MTKKQNTDKAANLEFANAHGADAMRAFLTFGAVDTVADYVERNGLPFAFSGLNYWTADKATAHAHGGKFVRKGKHAGQWYIRRAC